MDDAAFVGRGQRQGDLPCKVHRLLERVRRAAEVAEQRSSTLSMAIARLEDV